jgi:15-hydroxyprostaglandin dehydrogenase (NAD)
MTKPVAIVTGGSSGIGLALTQHLLAKGWMVVVADINPPPSSESLPADSSKYIKCNVASWDEQATMFAEAYSWGGRLDFAALNAGIDDRDDIWDSIDTTAPPRRPNMLTFHVNLLGVYYGAKLAAHYLARDPPLAAGALKHVTITSSNAGLYALPACPQYAATKHALVGMARSFAPKALARGVAVNALCPALVVTNLAPAGLLEHFPPEQVTPMATMLRGFDELMDPERRLSGEVVEVSLGDLFYREQVEVLSMGKTSGEAFRAFGETYEKRNVGFAREGWEQGGGGEF